MVSTDSIHLKNQETHILRITNKSLKDAAVFKFTCEGQATVTEGAEASSDLRRRGSYDLPRWLEVLVLLPSLSISFFGRTIIRQTVLLQIMPAAGLIKPGQFEEI
ncbi:hypothetical protein SAY87_019676 [Trapa incisa]|uniref:IP5PC-F immunoglobulin-like domain-containing protein n=1 Tax=Trapa incisa TaxID=236973 RepID=A0AAN7Q7P4_9MYRT|nr:hypothetical protein SAY87_019676 [Trapa incisa]